MSYSTILTWIMGIAALILPTMAVAQLSADWMIPAAAHNRGGRGTFWMTDLSLHNPHEYELPVVVQALPSNTANHDVPTISFTLFPLCNSDQSGNGRCELLFC